MVTRALRNSVQFVLYVTRACIYNTALCILCFPFLVMASLSEEVLLVVKKVRQRKQDGTLYLMAERIAWSPEGKDRFTVSHLYADIRCECPIPSNHPQT